MWTLYVYTAQLNIIIDFILHTNYAGYSSGICSLSVDPLASEILSVLPDTDLETYVSRLVNV